MATSLAEAPVALQQERGGIFLLDPLEHRTNSGDMELRGSSPEFLRDSWIIRYSKVPRYATPEDVERLYPVVQRRLGSEDIDLEGSHWGTAYGAFMEGEALETRGMQAQRDLHLMLNDVQAALLKTRQDDPGRLGNISEEDLVAMVRWTRRVIDTSFALFRGEVQLGDVFPQFRHDPPSAAFVVPTRGKSEGPATTENAAHFPVTWFLGAAAQARLLSKCPPIIVDLKEVQRETETGVVGKEYPVLTVWLPVSEDLIDRPDGGIDRAGIKVARRIVAAGAEYLRRLGVSVVGLGARLPSATRHGDTVMQMVPDIITTSGHAGTCAEIGAIVEGIRHRLELPKDTPITVIAVGSIGEVAAEWLLEINPAAIVTLFDTNLRRLQRVTRKLQIKYGERVKAASSLKEAVRASKIIISAATSKVPLDQIPEDIEGRIFGDDSQPGSICSIVTKKHGGKLVWIVGRGPEGFRRVPVFTFPTDSGAIPWDYDLRNGSKESHGLANPSYEFGCGLETLALALRYTSLKRDLVEKGNPPMEAHRLALEEVRGVAVQRAVTPADVRRIAKLFEDFGINGVGTNDMMFQAFGRCVDIGS